LSVPCFPASLFPVPYYRLMTNHQWLITND
jgi:hypothetical protein